MKLRYWLFFLIGVGCLFHSTSSCAQPTGPPLGISDEGGTAERPVHQIDCAGADIACTQSGSTGTITVTGAAVVTGWTDDGTTVRLTTSTDNVSIGADTEPSTQKLQVTGTTLLGGNTTIGLGTKNTDYTLTFDGETNDGVLTWREDENLFLFDNNITFGDLESDSTLAANGGKLILNPAVASDIELTTLASGGASGGIVLKTASVGAFSAGDISLNPGNSSIGGTGGQIFLRSGSGSTVGPTHVGNPADIPGFATGRDDLFITGQLEVDSGTRFDGTVTFTNADAYTVNDNLEGYYGTDQDAQISWVSVQEIFQIRVNTEGADLNLVGDTTNTAVPGGPISLQAGSATAADQNGGDVTLTAGAATGTGTPVSGSINLNIQTSTNGAGGDIDLNTTDGGEIQLDGGLTDIGTGTYVTVNGDNDLGVAGDFEVLGVIDHGAATSLEIPNAANPTADATGEIAVDTTDGQLIYFDGTAERVISRAGILPMNKTIEALQATDDNMAIWTAEANITLIEATCHCMPGTCTTEADLSLEHIEVGAGTVNDVTGTIDCEDTSTGDTATTLSGDTTVDAGDIIRFDVDNTPSPSTDTYQIHITYRIDTT